MTRDELISDAISKCMREIYSLAQPEVDFDDFLKENKEYLEREKEYYKIPEKERPPYIEYMGPKPYEFYYIPKNVIKNITDSYVHAYRFDTQQELLDTIEILKNYCKAPIVTRYVEEYKDENGKWHPGERGYDHPDNLKEEIKRIFTQEILPQIAEEYNKKFNLNSEGIESSVSSAYAETFQNKFFEFLDKAGKFYSWNRDLNSFLGSIYLGASPNTNKEAVIENWKKYRNKDIEIDESKYKEEEEDDE